MMSYLDLAGCSFASETAKSTKMVTKKISEVIFHSPVKVNSLLKIYGEVERIGNTSITIKLEARRMDVQSGNEKPVCSAAVVFVKVNDYGEPCPINLPKIGVIETITPVTTEEPNSQPPVLKSPLTGKIKDGLSAGIRSPADAERFMMELDFFKR